MQKLAVFISSVLLGVSESFVLNENGKKIANIYIKVLLTSMIIISLYIGGIYINSFIKPFVIMFIFFVCGFLIKKDDVRISMLNAFYLQFLGTISDIIFGLVFYIFLSDANIVSWISTPFGTIVCNLASSLILYFLSTTSLMKKLYDKLDKSTMNFNRGRLIVLFAFSLFVMITLFYAIYYHYYSNHLALYIVVVMMFILYTIIFFMILFYYNKYNEIRSKYSVSLDSLEEYEEMINKYRITNHENKNQLMLIRNMEDFSKAKSYIDDLIQFRDNDKNDILTRAQKVPKSYLRTVIYTKMLMMDKNSINNDIIVGRKVSSKQFIKMDNKTMIDVCNITNVFLDNAIEASLETKEKNILIEIDKEDGIVITISNNYSGDIESERISNPGYTTKGKGHGYGLALVNEIVSKNDNITHETELNGKIFTQILKIKM